MTITLALLLGIVVGIAIGAIAATRISAAKAQAELRLREQSEATNRAQIAVLQTELSQSRSDAESRGQAHTAAQSQLASATALIEERNRQADALRSEIESLRTDLLRSSETNLQQSSQISRLETELRSERQSLAEKLALLETAKQSLANQFQALAGEILDQKSRSFSEANQKELGNLLQPLRDQLKDFREKVEQTHVQTQTGVGKLETLVSSLNQMNQQLAVEAHNLSTALRGSAKAQGDWGEFILRDLLEKAGLREGEQYRFQESFSAETTDDGTRSRASRTDVILNLPGNRHLIVDSKVSLNAYTDYVNATTDDLRKAALKSHLVSVRTHFDGLSKRDYHKLRGIDSPDFVVMFVPIEPAFLLAMQEGGDLWRDAYERSVLLVGPTTLLFVIRIIDNLWRQEQQARSVQEIVDRGTKLYEKFVNFVSDLEDVGEALRKAGKSYDGAMNKLSTGSGNLVGQAEKLKRLGLPTGKQLSPKLLENAGLDEEDPIQLSLAAEADKS
ncbi:DNA recombination protein RmuC [Acidicapsa dinghuensis]|uniref:DNA recombination protein RmuC n=1 Tax=Acidicapsa dinghuensis TaxID=2218256 RepID=A0ABW1EE85_9BACT|nr:DNA recombination protein RmuC [Acidicapsa dinghuensis]